MFGKASLCKSNVLGKDFIMITSNDFVSIKYHEISIFVVLVKPFIAISIS